jgi:hypothetical protein
MSHVRHADGMAHLPIFLLVREVRLLTSVLLMRIAHRDFTRWTGSVRP